MQPIATCEGPHSKMQNLHVTRVNQKCQFYTTNELGVLMMLSPFSHVGKLTGHRWSGNIREITNTNLLENVDRDAFSCNSRNKA